MTDSRANSSTFGVLAGVMGFLAFAMLAILMSVIGFIHRESLRPLIAGAALGGLAITFQFAVVLFMALLFVLLWSAVVDQLDFGF